MNQNNAEKSKSDSETVSMILKNVNEFGLFSFEREEMREESAIAQAGQMLVALSVFSAVVLMVTPVLMEYTDISNVNIFIFLAIVLSLLSVCFIFTILAQSRYDYCVPADIDMIHQIVYEKEEEFSMPDDFLLLWQKEISEIHQSKKKMNDKRIRLIQISLVILIFTIFIANFLILYIYCNN